MENNTNQIVLDAPVYPHFDCVDLTDIEADGVEFTLYCRVNPKIYITATVNCFNTKSHTIFGDDDPENDISVDFDSLEVHEDSRPIVIDFDNVCSAHGLQLQLTDKQIQNLNGQIQDLLEERFRASCVKHDEDMKEHYAEMQYEAREEI